MAEDVGCARPTGRVLGQTTDEPKAEDAKPKEVTGMSIQVGQRAPDFEAPAFHEGKFINVKLSDSLGRWVLLCFYPGDFTFV
jgi:hypothetical protein